VPYFTALIRPDGAIRKSAGSPKGAPGKSQAEMTARHTAHPGPQGLEAHQAERRFDPEVRVNGVLRIADHQERDILLVRAD
jgi:hypothetical protein